MIINCLICNKPKKISSSILKYGDGKFCSRKCYGISKRGKPTWNKGMATFDSKKYNRKWRIDHKKWLSEYVKKWKKNNPEKNRKMYMYKQQWRKDNPEREKLYQEKRKAFLLKAMINDFTLNQWMELLIEYNNCCAYCGKWFPKLTQDHIIPLNRGGNHTKLNIVPACSSCNCRKNDILMSEDIKSNFKLFKIYLRKEEYET